MSTQQKEVNLPLKQRDETIIWHTGDEEQVLQRLETSLQGLPAARIAELQARYGKNTFPSQEPLPLWKIILHQFLSPLIYILLAAAAISLFLGEYTDAGFIIVVLVINAALGTYQEWRAEQSAAALQSLLKIYARVRRDGQEQRIEAEELVPGDLIVLESGDRVPADVRLLKANNLTVDESFLTGESIAADKRVGPLTDGDLPVSDRDNMGYAGATVLSGRAQGVVVATGLQTEIGKIAEATTSGEATKAPLVIRMDRFVRYISIAVLVAMVAMIMIAMAQGEPFTEIFFLAVALAVSAIPEGLPVALTVALSIAVNRMAKRRVIVRKMTAVEGLGSCTLIASDKTGTLTVNKQTIKALATVSGEQFTLTGEGYSGEGEVRRADEQPVSEAQRTWIEHLARAGVLCNEGDLRRTEQGWTSSGDAVDIAFLALGYKVGFDPQQINASVTTLHEIPFESERQYAARIYREGEQTMIAVKGAAERLLPFCQHALGLNGEALPLDHSAIEQQVTRMADDGYRVLALATSRVPEDLDGTTIDDVTMPPLMLLGLVGMIDPLRPEVIDAVRTCQRAGVQVAMITGDHPATALAIARELGIAEQRSDVVVGRDLPDVETGTDPTFVKAVREAEVFARVTPLQKLRIVEAKRALGHFVAVTGDGVNDAPALRAANIGVAMGSGTDVAKDTASIIVTDDNFASIVEGVEEGRYAYDNVRKVIYLLISTGAAEIALFLVALLVGLPLPLLAVQILWLNLVTNGIQGVALAFEEGEPGAMQRPPRDPGEGIFNPLMIQQTLISAGVMFGATIAVWYWLLEQGVDQDYARNLLLLLMVLFQNVHVFNCRSEYVSAFRVPLQRNLLLIVGVFAALGLHVLSMYIPFMQELLGIAPVMLTEFFGLLAIALSILLVLEIFKVIKQRAMR
ncbi:MAG: HAD family hydrolase [Chloroflexia bacterium]|nr:HAD family hydrolase [Chloroflexia bacterium]